MFVLDRVRTNQMPNLTSHYHSERVDRLTKFPDEYIAPPDGFTFDLRVDTEIRRVNETILCLSVSYYLVGCGLGGACSHIKATSKGNQY